MLSEFSGIALALQRRRCAIEPRQFHPWVLAELGQLIPFNSAIWLTAATMDSVRAGPYACHLHNMPQSLRGDDVLLSPLLALSRRALRTPGEIIAVQFGCTSLAASAHFCPFLERYHIASASLVVVVDALTRVYAALALFRGEGSPPFRDDEVDFQRALLPHLIESWNTNRLMAILRGCGSSGEAMHATAIVDRDAALQICGEQFAELLRSEWPYWKGPFVPPALVRMVRREPSRYIGEAIVVQAQPGEDEILLRVRRRSGFDRLGRREMEVAWRFAEGMTQKEIARELSLSPSTVSNHLVHVYEKLNVSNKAQLARLVAKYE